MLPFPIISNTSVLPPRGNIVKVLGSGQNANTIGMLYSTGKLYMIGPNSSGSFGLGDNTARTTWTLVASDVEDFAINDSSTIYRSTDGKIMGAGSLSVPLPSSGIANSNLFKDYSGYFASAGTISGYKKIYLDGWNYRCLVLNSTDTLYCSGNNINYATGKGTSTGSGVMAALSNGTNVKTFQSALYVTTVIKNDGTVWVCGTNTRYQIAGTNTSNTQTTLAQRTAAGLIEDVAMSEYLTMFIGTDGSTYALGFNNTKEAGISTTNITSITATPLTSARFINHTGNIYHNTICTTTSLYSAGDNPSGRLGIASGASNVTVWTQCSYPGSVVISNIKGLASTVTCTVFWTDDSLYMAGNNTGIYPAGQTNTFVLCTIPL